MPTSEVDAFTHGEAFQHSLPPETSMPLMVVGSGDSVTGVVSPSDVESNDKADCPDSKRQKMLTYCDDGNFLTKTNNGSRHVVQTLSVVDIINDGNRWRNYGQKLGKGNPNPSVSRFQMHFSPSKASEKILDDGYSWRKYGQKLVKGNDYIRSYDKCTHPNCLAKKQVERSHGGVKTDINYLGEHKHPNAQHSPHVASSSEVRVQEIPIAMPTSEADAGSIITRDEACQHSPPPETSMPLMVVGSGGSVTGVISPSDVESHDKADCPDSKLQKILTSCGDCNFLTKPNNESQHVVQPLSVVDIINDGYRWRKYGQILVKGNPNARSYYRCSNTGCPVKKHVERASHDPQLVVTTYEGQHDHGMPLSRTVNRSAAEKDSAMSKAKGELTSKSREKQVCWS